MTNCSARSLVWLVGLLLLGCGGCKETSVPGAGLPEERTAAPVAAVAPVQERHCELILLDPSPTPLAEVAAETATSETATGESTHGPVALVSHIESPATAGQEPPRVKEFRRLHREIPAAVVQALRTYHFGNYSVHIAQVRDDYYAVRYFEYGGSDFALDMASLEHDPDYRQWRDQWEACQMTLLPLRDNQWWAPLHEIGHVE